MKQGLEAGEMTPGGVEGSNLSIGTSRFLSSTNVLSPLQRPIECTLPSTGIHCCLLVLLSAQNGKILCTGPFVRPGMHEKSQGVTHHFFGQQVVVIQHQEQRLWLPFLLQVFPRSLWQPLAVAARHPGETAPGAL